MTSPDLWPGMTRTHHAALDRYLHSLADELGLRDWEITLADEHDGDEDNLAATLCTLDSRQATVYLGECFTRRPRSVQRVTLVHELLHCHFSALVRFGIYAPRDALGMAAASVHESGLKMHAELTIDSIACAIAGKFPLPPVG